MPNPLSPSPIHAPDHNTSAGPSEFFSPSYASARDRFRARVRLAGGRLHSLEIAATGPLGDPLTIDIAWFGAASPRRVFLHTSGLHGIEAFTGSAIQLRILDGVLPALPADGALVFAHVLNPYGMAWLRRFNENNVDLNRNFLAPGEAFAGAPADFHRVASFLNPATPPSDLSCYLQVLWLVARHGMNSLKQSIAGGQYCYPGGLFYGGARLEEGPSKWRDFLSANLRAVEEIVVVDVHTGLGKFAGDRMLVDGGPPGDRLLDAMRRTYGSRLQVMDPNGVAFLTRGAQFNLYYQLFPQAKIFFAAQEFGTYPGIRVLRALRAENYWRHSGGSAACRRAKEDLMEMFNPRALEWRHTVLRRGAEAFGQAFALAFD